MTKTKSKTLLDMYRSVRKTWPVNPVTKVVKDKTKYTRKKKHKGSGDCKEG